MSSSVVPHAIDALLAALEAAAPAGVRVVDGFPRFAITDVDFIAVGGTPDPTATGERVAAGLGGRRHEQTFLLTLTCSSSRGVNTAQKVVRDRAYELLGVLETVLGDDPSLGGVIRSAEVTSEVLEQPNVETAAKGTYADLVVGVACRTSL